MFIFFAFFCLSAVVREARCYDVSGVSEWWFLDHHDQVIHRTDYE